jgi:hypothetical protein
MKAQYFLNRLNRLNLLEPFYISTTPIVLCQNECSTVQCPILDCCSALHLYFPADAVTFT